MVSPGSAFFSDPSTARCEHDHHQQLFPFLLLMDAPPLLMFATFSLMTLYFYHVSARRGFCLVPQCVLGGARWCIYFRSRKAAGDSGVVVHAVHLFTAVLALTSSLFQSACAKMRPGAAMLRRLISKSIWSVQHRSAATGCTLVRGRLPKDASWAWCST